MRGYTAFDSGGRRQTLPGAPLHETDGPADAEPLRPLCSDRHPLKSEKPVECGIYSST